MPFGSTFNRNFYWIGDVLCDIWHKIKAQFIACQANLVLKWRKKERKKLCVSTQNYYRVGECGIMCGKVRFIDNLNDWKNG